ncbi:MAG: ATP-binding protein [Planctomycetia bacterium]|nr:ATP-binding protein [Planctomycetia bacterium]
MIRSLRTRLLLGVGAGSMAVLVVAGLVLYALLRAALVGEFDASLDADARTLATLVEQEGTRVKSEMAERAMERFQRAARPDYYELRLRDGTVLERSTRLSGHDWEPIAGTLERPEIRFATLPDGRPGRMIGVTFTPGRDGDPVAPDEPGPDSVAASLPMAVTLVLARDTLDLDRALGRIRMLLVVVFGAAVIAALAIAAPIVRVGLRPLRAISTRIEAIDSRTLTAPLASADAPAEVQSVIDCLNGLLRRLDAAFRRERAFSANVAHELRTPLAGLLGTIEVALTRPREAAEYRHALATCLEICRQTEGIVENLLSLARIDAGQSAAHRRTVRLDDVLGRAWTPLAGPAESRGLGILWNVDPDLTADTDPDKLLLILRNLLDNAVTYADSGGTIDVVAKARDGVATIVIGNTGSRLAPHEVARAFDRFSRGDASRQATGSHAGLGLPLSKELAGLLGASLSATSDDGGRFEVRLEIPCHGEVERTTEQPGRESRMNANER